MKRLITVVISMFALGVFLAPRMKADEWNQATKFTFSEPVEIPGQVLPAGTYWFKLLDSPSDRNIVQIFNADQTKVFATILAIPDYRLEPTGKTVITFEERASNAPQAIQAWFYPGENFGQEFVYPKVRAVQLAKMVNKPVPSMPSNLEANTKMPANSATEAQVVALKRAPVKAEQPNGEETEIAQVTKKAPETSSTETPAKLPQTASDLPLVAFAGLTLFASGMFLLLGARRTS